MRLLLDTCTFLWLIWDDPQLKPVFRSLLADPRHAVFLSAASVWEAVVKHQKGKLQLFTDEPAWQHFVVQRANHLIDPLPIDEGIIEHLAGLPDIHKDPFDRLLICQAIEHGLAIVTPDPLIRRYPIKTVW